MKAAETRSAGTASKSTTPFFSRSGEQSFFSSTETPTSFFYSSPSIQARQGAPGSLQERPEAGSISEDNYSLPITQPRPTKLPPAPTVQTKCAECEKEETQKEYQGEIEDEEGLELQKKKEVEVEKEDELGLQKKSSMEKEKDEKLGLQRKPAFESMEEGEPGLQKKCSECEKEEKHQEKKEEEDDEMDLQRKPAFEIRDEEEGQPGLQKKCTECENEEQQQGKKEDEMDLKLKLAQGNLDEESDSPGIQARCAHCEEEDKVQMKKEEDEEMILQGKSEAEGEQGEKIIQENILPGESINTKTEGNFEFDSGPLLQRACEACEQEERKDKEDGEEKEKLDRKPISDTMDRPEDQAGNRLPLVQTKLTVGKPGDKYEKEADAVADQTIQRISSASSGPVQDGMEKKPEEEIQKDPIPEFMQMSMMDGATLPEDPDEKRNGLVGISGVMGMNIQRRCRECEEGDIVFRKALATLQLANDPNIKGNGSRESVVAFAKSQVGKVEAKTNDGSGKRKGADRLLEYFNIAAPGVWPDNIIETAGAQMPSWCGIFSVWAHKKAGKDIGTWQMGKGVSAFNTLVQTKDPQPGDIGYIDQPYQHHCIVVKVEGNSVHSIDGNSGLFSEVKENIRTLGDYSGFFTAFGSGVSAVQRKEEISQAGNASSGTLERKLNNSKGKGTPLPKPIRNSMESAMGADFSGVRVHTDSQANSMSKDLRAQAFTHGSDIYFNTGKYDTGSRSGQHLLSHELTHTVQQGAAVQLKEVPIIQRNGGGSSDEEAATAVYDALDGYTSSDDSFIVWNNFDSKGKASTDAIMRSVASKNGSSITEVYDWMLSDMVTSDWKRLLGHFINVQAYMVEKAIAIEVADYLSGYTSEDNSHHIYSVFVGTNPINGVLLDRVLTQLEVETNNSRNPMAEYLFGDLTSLDAHRLSTHFFNAGSTYGAEYASYWIAFKIKNLLSGYTSTSDSDSIVKNFKRVPTQMLSRVLFELEKLTQEDWEETAAQAMMDDMQQDDYEALRVMMPDLPVYNPQKSFLEWAWDKFSVVLDFLVGLIEYAVCGLVGLLVGALSVIADIVIMVIDLLVAVKELIGMIIYYASGGSICRESKEKVFEFFSGIGQFFDAPGDAVSKMWDEMVLEASLIEGPFQECGQAYFWCKKVGNLLVNLVLILAAGYGAIKIALEGIEALVALIRAGELLNAIKSIPGKLLSKIRGMPSSLAKSTTTTVAKVIELFRNPVKTISNARNTVTALRLAIQDEGYFKFLRRQSGRAIKNESEFWKERKEFWKKGGDEVDGHIASAEGRLTTAAETAVDDPEKATALVAESETSAQAAERRANELMDEVKGTREAGEPAKPAINITAEAEAWERTLSEETRSFLQANPETRRFWHEMDPDVRRALTLCNTPCIPMNIDPGTVADIQRFMQRMNIKDHNGLREYLHMYRSDPKQLADAVKTLDTIQNLRELETLLDNRLIDYIKKTHGVTIRRGPNGLWEYPMSPTNVVKEFETGTHGFLTSNRGTNSFFQSHHGVQDAWAQSKFSGLNVYSREEAPALLLRSRNLEGGSRGTPHGLINDLQGARKPTISTRTFAEERAALVKDLDIIGVPADIKAGYLKSVDKYFGDIYTTLKKTMNDTGLKSLFGDWVP